jgi:hypothetical protein
MLRQVLYSVARSYNVYYSVDNICVDGIIFRPRLKPRLTLDNALATAGFVIEFVSHCNAAATGDYFGYAKAEPVELEPLPGNSSMPAVEAVVEVKTLAGHAAHLYKEVFSLLFWGYDPRSCRAIRTATPR